MTSTHGITYRPDDHGQTACNCGDFHARWDSPTQRATAIARGVQHIADNGYKTVDNSDAGGTTALIAGPTLIPAADPLHEWQCPSCGATTRAQMADHAGADQ